MLRAQAAFGLIKETGDYVFAASRLTKLFKEANVGGAINQL